MSLELTELRDSARDVLGGLGLAADEARSWRQIVDLGWLQLTVPEELGGLGEGAAAACAMHRELGAHLATVPYLPALLAIEAVCRSDPLKAREWIARLTAGEYVATSLATSSLTLPAGERLVLSGSATAVPSADSASQLLVPLVMSGESTCIAMVPRAQPRVDLVPRETWDRTRRLFDIRFGSVELQDGQLLVRGAAAQALIARLDTLRDFALAADSVGGAETLLAMTVEHLKTRRQFARPLALFQALKHRCADLKAELAAAEALLLDSLARLDHGAEEHNAARMGKAVKQLACATYYRVAEEAMQLHGGIAMTAEHPCHLFLKRALLNEQLGRARERYEFDLAAELVANT